MIYPLWYFGDAVLVINYYLLGWSIDSKRKIISMIRRMLWRCLVTRLFVSYWYLIVCSKKGFCYSTQPPAKRIWSVKDILWLLSDHWMMPRTGQAARGVRGTILSTETQPWQSSADPADHLLQTHKKMAAEAINYTLLCSAMYLPSPDANQAKNSSNELFPQIH